MNIHQLVVTILLGSTTLFDDAEDRGNDEHEDNGHTLDRQEVGPDLVRGRADDGTCAANRATPRQHVHHRRRQSDEREQDVARHTHRLVERQQRGDGEQECCGARAVQVRDDRDGSSADCDQNRLAASRADQRLNHRLEQADVRKNAEVDDGEDEHHHDLHDSVESVEVEVRNLCNACAGEYRTDDRDQRHCDDRMGFAFEEQADRHHDDGKAKHCQCEGRSHGWILNDC